MLMQIIMINIKEHDKDKYGTIRGTHTVAYILLLQQGVMAK